MTKDLFEVNFESEQDTAHIIVKNNQSQKVYARARAIINEEVYSCSYSGESWESRGDEYYYYNNIIENNGSAEELLIHIDNIPFPEESLDGETFNVSIIVETAKVLYDEGGNPYAEWTGTTSEGGEG